MMVNVAFLGTGLLGSGMTEAMLGRGNTVTVWNRTASKARALEALGAKVAPSPEEAVAASDYVHMALPDAGVVDVFAMANGVGVTPADAISLFSKFQVAGAIPSRGAKMSRGDFSATFELTMARKDMRLMIEASGDQPLAVLPAIAKRMDDA